MQSNRVRHLLVAMIAVLAIGAIAADAALAAPEVNECTKVAAGTGEFEKSTCEGVAGTKEFKWAPITENVAYEANLHPAVVSHLESEIGGVTVSIVCEAAKSIGAKNNLKVGGASEGEMEFSACKTFQIVKHDGSEVPGCKVEPIKLKTADQTVRNATNNGVEDEFKPSPATTKVFGEIEIKTCVLEGKYKVETEGAAGSTGQTCGILVPSFAEKEHEMICTGPGSKLLFATKKARFWTDLLIKLVNGGRWFVE